MSHVWTPADDVLVPLPFSPVPMHVRAYVRRPNELAVVLGEFSDQSADLMETLPWFWRRLAEDVDPDAAQIFTYAPVAADPFRRHVSGRDIAGGPVAVREVALAPTRSKRAGRCRLADGPIVGVWRAQDYLHTQWRRFIPVSPSIRWGRTPNEIVRNHTRSINA